MPAGFIIAMFIGFVGLFGVCSCLIAIKYQCFLKIGIISIIASLIGIIIVIIFGEKIL